MRTLMYHDLAPREQRDTIGFPGPLAARYKLEPKAFEAHLDALAATGLGVGTFDARGAEPAVTLSFDDGGASAPLAAAALERRGWRGQFFVTTSRIDTPGFVSAQELRDMSDRGHLIGSHSHSHPTYMGRLSDAELYEEWSTSRAVLADALGAEPRTASVPGGFLAKAVISTAAAAGFEVLFTSEPNARALERELAVRGRYTIWASTPARVAAAYAQGELIACGRLWLEWNAKKRAKSISPAAYQALRRVRAWRA